MSARLALALDVWDPHRGGLEAYARDFAEQIGGLCIVCGHARAPVPEGCELVELDSSGPKFYAQLDRRADELGTLLAFRHPGASARVFLPLGGLLAASLDARRASEAPWLRWPRTLARALSPKTRCYLAREATFLSSRDPSRVVLASSDLVRREIEQRFPAFGGTVEVTGLPLADARLEAPFPGADEKRAAVAEVAGEQVDICVLWIGNDPVRKGLPQARAVIRRLRARKLRAVLVCAGYGTERWAGDGVLGLGHVDTGSLYRAADVLLAPSLEDNLSFVVLEALAAGVPVVTTSRNGAASYVSSDAVGRVVEDAKDVHALDGATLAVLERGMLDVDLRRLRRDAVASCRRSEHFERIRGLLARLDA